jgi:hypothetical protein
VEFFFKHLDSKSFSPHKLKTRSFVREKEAQTFSLLEHKNKIDCINMFLHTKEINYILFKTLKNYCMLVLWSSIEIISWSVAK